MTICDGRGQAQQLLNITPCHTTSRNVMIELSPRTQDSDSLLGPPLAIPRPIHRTSTDNDAAQGHASKSCSLSFQPAQTSVGNWRPGADLGRPCVSGCYHPEGQCETSTQSGCRGFTGVVVPG